MVFFFPFFEWERYDALAAVRELRPTDIVELGDELSEAFNLRHRVIGECTWDITVLETYQVRILAGLVS